MRRYLCLTATAVTILAGGCSSNRSPSPQPARAMDSALTQVHDSGSTPDSTVSDTTPPR
jgi:ABC-type phosphate/phosphonate transport system substrate-binding protein